MTTRRVNPRVAAVVAGYWGKEPRPEPSRHSGSGSGVRQRCWDAPLAPGELSRLSDYRLLSDVLKDETIVAVAIAALAESHGDMTREIFPDGATARKLLALPIYPELTEMQQEYVIGQIRRSYER